MPVRSRTRTPALLVAGLVLSLGTACTSSAGSSGSTAARSAVAPTGGAPAPAGAPGAAQVSVGSRAVVRTASLSLRVSSVREAADRARTLTEQAGGGLEAEDDSGTTDVLRLRVPPERLAGALDALARLGTETGRTVGSEDVTGQAVDLQSRLATQRASVERVRALMETAKALPDVVTLERELAEREGALESLQAQVKALQGQTDLATVTVTLTPVAAVAASTGFRGGLSAGVDAFRATTRVAAVALGAVLPFLPLLALVLWLARWLGRRSARSAT